jgi:ADP-heptose:LPS heptosyltransferase
VSAAIAPRKLPATICGPAQGFQPDTPVPTNVFNFVFNDEGMGGFLNYAACTYWMAKNCPWIHGRVWVEQFLVPILQDIHAEFKHWKVQPHNQFQRLVEHGTPTIGPMMAFNGMQAKREFLTALGTHPLDVGSGYYMSTCPAPADCLLPVLDYPLSRLTNPKLRRELSTPYVVITCGGRTPIRTMTGTHINPLIEHVLAKGMRPVFLGKRDMLTDGKVTTDYADDTNYSAGLDLRDQTDVRTAATIMQHAQCTVGLDGGLLHLAALMKDSRIVFGYNITSVAHREPRRNHGRHVNVTLTKQELPCIGCQSTWKNMFAHLYDKCGYAEGRFAWDPQQPERANACLRLLFANDSIKFKNAIDEVLR